MPKKIPFGLSFLYNNFFGKKVRPVVTRKWFSSLIGRYADSSLSKRHIQKFIKNYAIDMNEAERPANAYRSFNDFFTRTLKPGARPINQEPHTLTSPADGTVIGVTLEKKRYFTVKNKIFNLERFLHNNDLACEYADGILLIFRLAPWDYHRFHFPYDCLPSQPQRIRGIYESVHPLVYQTGIQPLTENERQLIKLTTDNHELLMISVGALCVGKITHTFTPHTTYKKGHEAGYFSFGGSTVVLVFKPNTVSIDQEILTNSACNLDTPIKMGENVGIFLY